MRKAKTQTKEGVIKTWLAVIGRINWVLFGQMMVLPQGYPNLIGTHRRRLKHAVGSVVGMTLSMDLEIGPLQSGTSSST